MQMQRDAQVAACVDSTSRTVDVWGHHLILIHRSASLLDHRPVLINAALHLLGLIPTTVSLHIHGVVFCAASGHDCITAPLGPWSHVSLASRRDLSLDAPVGGVPAPPA